jgi:hypothetical protein
MAFITCTWFVFIVTLLAGPSLAGALLRGRRPPRWLNAGLGAGIGAFLLLPAALNLLGNSAGQPWYWSDSFPRDIPTIFIQWWPVYVPWLVLCFGWKRLSFAGRWLHLWLVPIVLSVELFYINQRTTMMEKTLGGAFGVGQAALYPLLFTQRGWLYRGLSVVIVVSGLISAAAWTITSAEGLDWDHVFCRLEGDHFLHDQESQVRLEQTLRCLHGKTVVAGRARHAWFRSPTVVAFSENRCYLGWTNAEEVAGHPVEANEREREINAFFDGKIADPLEFLARANASAVMVWPEDKISDGWVDGMKQKLGAEFVYINCKGEDADNAGLFIRRELAPNK